MYGSPLSLPGAAMRWGTTPCFFIEESGTSRMPTSTCRRVTCRCLHWLTPAESGRYYKVAVDAYPTHATVIVKFANLLKSVEKDYDEAEKYYKLAIKANPKHAESLGSYAVLLHGTRQQFDVRLPAGGCMRRAHELTPPTHVRAGCGSVLQACHRSMSLPHE